MPIQRGLCASPPFFRSANVQTAPLPLKQERDRARQDGKRHDCGDGKPADDGESHWTPEDLRCDWDHPQDRGASRKHDWTRPPLLMFTSTSSIRMIALRTIMPTKAMTPSCATKPMGFPVGSMAATTPINPNGARSEVGPYTAGVSNDCHALWDRRGRFRDIGGRPPD